MVRVGLDPKDVLGGRAARDFSQRGRGRARLGRGVEAGGRGGHSARDARDARGARRAGCSGQAGRR